MGIEKKIPPLIVILGPTASGKTRLAVDVARQVNGAVISADSRQVYRGMDIGTGKDLEEYAEIPYYLIDIINPGEAYHIVQYREDFFNARDTILHDGRQPILCGGSGMYIDAVLRGMPYSNVPINEPLRSELDSIATSELLEQLSSLKLPPNFRPDNSTRKRIIRAIEIASWHRINSVTFPQEKPIDAYIFGVNPPLEARRQRITERLERRLELGLIEEVKGLLDQGLSPDQLIYYGLEYKYTTRYLLGKLDYSSYFDRLNTEIHRFAKRQMTYFRKMERDGLKIHWLETGSAQELLPIIQHIADGND